MVHLSNRLTVLAGRIGEAHAAMRAASRKAAEKALEAGRLLIEAKAECQHGEWLPLLESASIHERQAQRLMQLARSGLKSDTVSDLGIKGALSLAIQRRPPRSGQVLLVTTGDLFANPRCGSAWVWEAGPGRFHVAGLAQDSTFAAATRKPVLASHPDATQTIFYYVDAVLEHRHQAMRFTTLVMPADVLERFRLAVIEDQDGAGVVQQALAVIEEADRRIMDMEAQA